MNIIEFYQSQNKPIKLNIGCRNKPLPTYVNIDIDPNNQLADLIDNGFELNTIKDNSCDLIEAVHMAEHLSLDEFKKALSVWCVKLKAGGTIRLSVPDALKCSSLFNLTQDRNLVKSMFMGSQLNEWDFHKSMHTYQSLSNDLDSAGFTYIRPWNYWETFPHNYCDSYASSTWPHMQKIFKCDNGKTIDMGGICLSLNLEATK